MTSGLKAKAALSERGEDLYETPAVAVTALLEGETLPSVVWEPACGPGAIVGVLRAAGHTVIATDLNDWGCPDSEPRRNFLFEQRAPDGCECIITNPPYKLAQEFVLKARELAPKVVMLLRLGFLESERRRTILESGDLARVFVFRNRLPMMHRFGWTGPRASSATAYAWFVWDRAHCGPTELYRISWVPAPVERVRASMTEIKSVVAGTRRRILSAPPDRTQAVLPIDQIIVGDRARRDLTTNIAKISLLNPIIVNENGRLLAGARRLRQQPLRRRR